MPRSWRSPHLRGLCCPAACARRPRHCHPASANICTSSQLTCKMGSCGVHCGHWCCVVTPKPGPLGAGLQVRSRMSPTFHSATLLSSHTCRSLLADPLTSWSATCTSSTWAWMPSLNWSEHFLVLGNPREWHAVQLFDCSQLPRWLGRARAPAGGVMMLAGCYRRCWHAACACGVVVDSCEP
jgi:hypothetical protein